MSSDLSLEKHVSVVSAACFFPSQANSSCPAVLVVTSMFSVHVFSASVASRMALYKFDYYYYYYWMRSQQQHSSMHL